MTATDPAPTGPPAPETFAIPLEAAEAYESLFVPAFFAQWAPVLCDAAGVGAGQRVLDVGCGTGIVARTALPLVGPNGSVAGLDLNEAMLTVARRVCRGVELRAGDAGDLPWPDATFDTVLTQMALMFFPDRAAAVAEMARVVVPGGTVAAVVPSALAGQPAFAPFVELAVRHAGPEAASLLGTYFACGGLDRLAGLLESAGLHVETARSVPGVYRAPSVDAFVTTEVESTPLVQRMSAEEYARIRAGAGDVLGPFTDGAGAVVAPFGCDLVAARRRTGDGAPAARRRTGDGAVTTLPA